MPPTEVSRLPRRLPSSSAPALCTTTRPRAQADACPLPPAVTLRATRPPRWQRCAAVDHAFPPTSPRWADELPYLSTSFLQPKARPGSLCVLMYPLGERGESRRRRLAAARRCRSSRLCAPLSLLALLLTLEKPAARVPQRPSERRASLWKHSKRRLRRSGRLDEPEVRHQRLASSCSSSPARSV